MERQKKTEKKRTGRAVGKPQANAIDITSHKEAEQALRESEERWRATGHTAACRKWWAYMKDLMPSNPDNSPVSDPLKEVFHIG